MFAWTLNQLSRHKGETVEQLVATYSGLRTAHSAEDLRSVHETRRQLVTELVEAAKNLLEKGGSASSQATLQKVSQALYAGGSEEDRELLLQGRLVGDMGAPSLESAFGLVPGDEGAPPPSETDERLQALDREARAAEGSAAKLDQAAQKLEEMAEVTRSRLADAEEEARRARAKAEDAHKLATEAASRLAEAGGAANSGEPGP